MKWLWNWSKPKISSIVDNSQLEALRNDLTTLQNNVSNIQASLSSYLTNNQSYSLTNTSDKFVINVAKSANYLELQRGGSRKTTIGLGSSSSDNFSIESTGNIVLKPNQYIDANGSPIQNVASPTQANQVTTKQYVDSSIKQYVDNAIANIPQSNKSGYLYKFFIDVKINQTINATPTNPFYKTINLNTIQSQLTQPTYDVIKNMKFVSATPFGIIVGENKNPTWGVNIPSTLYIQGSSNGGIPTTFSYLEIAINISNYSGQASRYALALVGSSDVEISSNGLTPISDGENEIEILSIERI